MRDFAPTHPGEMLSEEFLKPFGLTQTQLAADLGVAPNRVNELVKGKRNITAETALMLGKYFGTTPAFWMNLQTHYDLEIAKVQSHDKLERVKPRETVTA